MSILHYHTLLLDALTWALITFIYCCPSLLALLYVRPLSCEIVRSELLLYGFITLRTYEIR